MFSVLVAILVSLLGVVLGVLGAMIALLIFGELPKCAWWYYKGRVRLAAVGDCALRAGVWVVILTVVPLLTGWLFPSALAYLSSSVPFIAGLSLGAAAVLFYSLRKDDRELTNRGFEASMSKYWTEREQKAHVKRAADVLAEKVIGMVEDEGVDLTTFMLTYPQLERAFKITFPEFGGNYDMAELVREQLESRGASPLVLTYWRAVGDLKRAAGVAHRS